MTFGFPAHYHARYPGRIRAMDVRAAVRATLAELSWRIKEERGDGIAATSGISWHSWGEQVHVAFLPDGSISVTSRCSYPLQCVDWGKNEANVRRFMKAIARRFEAGGA